MTNDAKAKIAGVLIEAAGNIVENLRCGNTDYMQEIAWMDADDVAEVLAKWLTKLPGDKWDNRLPSVG